MWFLILPCLWLTTLPVINPCELHLEMTLLQNEDPHNELWIDLCANTNGLWEWTCQPSTSTLEWEELTHSPLLEVLILAAFLEKSKQDNERILDLWLSRHQATRTVLDAATQRLSWSSQPWTGRVEILWDTRRNRILGASLDRIEAIRQEKMIFRYGPVGRMEIQWGRPKGEACIIQLN